MDLKDNIEELSKKIEKYKDRVANEEMTKTAFVLPFFDMLGYDTRNPFEFHAEFTADIADAKGEKVDYAILIDDIPRILVECKDCSNTLENCDKQLTRYFNVTPAKIGVLTNGIIYKFYTDLEKPNMMDDKPFLEITPPAFLAFTSWLAATSPKPSMLESGGIILLLSVIKHLVASAL